MIATARRLLEVLAQEVARTARRPNRLSRLGDPRAVARYAAFIVRSARWRAFSRPWSDDLAGPFQRRVYRNYGEYVAHQSAKLAFIDLGEYDERYRDALRARLRAHGIVRPGMSALCLAARIGTEVKAFVDVGCFAVGIDLNPGRGNRYVVHGDFHSLQYADASIDVVFTNSLDHALDIDGVVREVRRVLKPAGLFVLELGAGKPGFYESAAWESLDGVVRYLQEHAFALVQRSGFTYPWVGEHLTLETLRGPVNGPSAPFGDQRRARGGSEGAGPEPGPVHDEGPARW